RSHGRRRWAGALAAGLATLTLALPPVLDQVAERRQAAAAEQARDQLRLALSITSEKLTTATRTLRDAAPPAPADPGDTR
ncbi:MAG TPA: hypothetical protein VHQ65_10255, partial [Thermoanaerobaculia bacterium]|nr:hypothetical protein [Thermoanaerobaculia bacterium]